MFDKIKRTIAKLFAMCGYKIVRTGTFDKFVDKSIFLERAIKCGGFSRSQLFQDLFVLMETNGKRNGFFVEFGAADGKYLSNTYLLEKQFGWTGILAEPARIWFKELLEIRTCKIDHRCVWSKSDEKIQFNETEEPELSTINRYSDRDAHALNRERGSTYIVDTVSLFDLLDQNEAPKVIDYLSIDTEGSEYEILASFDFSKYDIRIITCEHNFTANREKIHALLVANGYSRRYGWMSDFDDWYVRE